MIRNRAAAIIVKDGKILLMHRTRNGQEFYVFPGGGVEEGETNEEACAREISEETTLTIKVKELVCKASWDDGSNIITMSAVTFPASPISTRMRPKLRK